MHLNEKKEEEKNLIIKIKIKKRIITKLILILKQNKNEFKRTKTNGG